jgi:putative heme-binding domain-containing protein
LEGRRLFFGPAGCALCHNIRGEGVAFGPDHSNLVFRDRASVLQDITHPSATINPDHAGSLVKFDDDTDASGLIRVLNTEKIALRLPAGLEIERRRAQVRSVEPMRNSLMPDGFEETLSAGQMEDLLTFLLTNPLEPAVLTRFDPSPPPARARKEFERLLANGSTMLRARLRVLLVADEKDHGIDEHDYPRWLERWSRLLALADQVTVATNIGFPAAAQLAAADVTVFCSRNSGWDSHAAALLDEYQERGGGLVYLHWGIEGGKAARALADRVGLAFSMSKFRHGELALAFRPDSHPITQGLDRLPLVDEAYWSLTGDPARITVLANSVEEGEPRPQVWVRENGRGRVFVCLPGHYTWTFDDPLYRVLVLRGICWAAGQPDINRLTELAPIGARLAP